MGLVTAGCGAFFMFCPAPREVIKLFSCSTKLNMEFPANKSQITTSCNFFLPKHENIPANIYENATYGCIENLMLS